MIPDSLFNADFNVFTQQLYPTHKRLPILLAKADALWGSNLNFLMQVFMYFRNGAYNNGVPFYDPSATYSYGQLMIYQRKVYLRNEVLINQQYGISYAAGVSPSSTLSGNITKPNTGGVFWTLMLNDFVGMNKRMRFGPSKIMFEFALNTEFNTTFLQPSETDYYTTGHSDIFVSNNNTSQGCLFIGQTTGGTVPRSDEGAATNGIPLDDASVLNKDFTIHVPNTFLSTLCSSQGDTSPYLLAQAVISSIANKYRPSGYLFNITGY